MAGITNSYADASSEPSELARPSALDAANRSTRTSHGTSDTTTMTAAATQGRSTGAAIGRRSGGARAVNGEGVKPEGRRQSSEVGGGYRSSVRRKKVRYYPRSPAASRASFRSAYISIRAPRPSRNVQTTA